MAEAKIGIIGGSGLYRMEGLEDIEQELIMTPFGDPSDEYILGTLEGVQVAFLPRHGRGHRHLPSELNYRANIWGFKSLGVEWIIAIGAVGSLKEELKPLDIVLPDQFYDRTNQARKSTFFGNGCAAHIGFADPTCSALREIIAGVADGLGVTVHRGGTYLNMEGPAFSTRAESNVYRSWGMDVIGMTNLAEAKLAREAEICYQNVAMVTDYDVWRSEEGHEDVSVETIIANLTANAAHAREIIKETVGKVPKKRDCECATALSNAIITVPELIPVETRQRLELIIGKYIK